ncbi:MAG: hypothetical protein E6Q42_00195 [Dechloromonas sp.]|jgi:hypothetical protein|nr:MAG: hypothetical protein E6Q42_00195 [Dechloromonas sp.]
MKLLCASNSLSFAYSLRVALDGEGIETYLSDSDSSVSGILAPATGSSARVYVLHDDDWERAVDVYRALAGERPASPPSAPAKRIPAWATVLLSMLSVIAVATLLR